MAARPSCRLSKANLTTKVVVTAAVEAYRAVSLSTSDSQCAYTAAGGAAYGFTQSAAAVGVAVTVAVTGCGETTRAKVGTGGATRGSWAVVVDADGRVTNAAALGGGTVARNVVGKFEETGVAGDEVGLILIAFTGASA